MNTRLDLAVTGIGAWLAGADGWPILRSALLGERELVDGADDTPKAAALLPAERRRAPANVRLAVEVAMQACAMASADAADLPCVFASTYGEPAITDYVCATLADDPLGLSPTKFHNSVLNAPAGYWTIATGCTRASSAVTAGACSFAAGLLEAATLASADRAPVLFVSSDTAATGPLADVIHTTRAFGAALVLDPGARASPRLRLALRAGRAGRLRPPPLALRPAARDNPANAHALALLSALASRRAAHLALPLSAGLALDLEIAF